MSGDDLADEIFGRCRERIERGETVDPDQVVRSHPEIAAALRERFDALSIVERTLASSRRGGRDALVGRRLGPYRLGSKLGSGGMGTVYLAEREGDGSRERVAVKVLHAHLLQRKGTFERFRREAELGRRVRHGAVVRTLDADAVELSGHAVHFLVMEYVEGRTLRALLAEEGRLPEELCRYVGREIAQALAAIHAEGAVHRDLKPENVIITPQHVVKVMDLGVARVQDEALRVSQTGAFVGSVRYAAPEQFRGHSVQVDGRADLYALGLTLYELATGGHPFDDDDFATVLRRQMDEVPRRAGDLNPQVSPFLEELLARLLEKDRAKRPESAGEVAQILGGGEESAWWTERSKAIRGETRRPLRRIRIERETKLHGRDAELALLRSLYERASKGDGQVVLIEGEAGIGKSRLVDEFLGLLAQAGEDVDFLCGSYPPGGAATASGAFTSAYREHLGDDESAIRAALPQTPLLVPAFAALLRGDVAPEGAEKLTKDSLQTVFVHATRSFASRRTTLVFIDDLHFAPEEGRALFASLALAVPGHRILLVGGARPSLDEKWIAGLARLPHLTRVPLARLGAKDLVRLLTDALGSQHVAEELAGRIATKSDGNPFFVFEILRGLREGRFLARKPDGTWITTREIREIQVPSSIVDVVQARVSDLGPDDRDAMEVAACVGFEFNAALVGDVLGVAPIPLLQRFGAIERRHRLVRSVGPRFAFDHHQVQEVLYAGISEPLREQYHAAIGTAIEARSGAASKEPQALDGAVCVDLAEHFLQGAQGGKALRYLDAALAQLDHSCLPAQAAGLTERALAVPGLLEATERARVVFRLTGRLDLLGRRERQLAAAREAELLAAAAGDAALRSRSAIAVGWCLWQTARHAEAEAAHRRALEVARSVGDRRLEALAILNLGNVLGSLTRNQEAREHHERSLALSRATGDRLGEATAIGALGSALLDLGHLEEARVHHERHLLLARAIGDRKGEARAIGNLGNALWLCGRCAEARDHQQRRLDLCRELGDRPGESFAAGCMANVLSSLGRYDESMRWTEWHLALAREIGDRQGEVQALASFGLLLLCRGRLADALEKYDLYLALSRDIGDRRGEAVALVNLGPLLAMLGAPGEGRAKIDRCLAICREFRLRRVEGYALEALGAVSEQTGDLPEAERLYAEALALRREIRYASGIATSLSALGALLASRGENDAAREHLAEAVRVAREIELPGAHVVAACRLALLPGGSPREAIAAFDAHADRLDVGEAREARFLLWRATRDPAHLAEAKRLLDHLIAHAPPEYRESMVANVALHRDIAAAAREHGLPLAADEAPGA